MPILQVGSGCTALLLSCLSASGKLIRQECGQKERDSCFLASCFGASKLKGISSIYTLHVWVNRVGGRPCRGAPHVHTVIFWMRSSQQISINSWWTEEILRYLWWISENVLQNSVLQSLICFSLCFYSPGQKYQGVSHPPHFSGGGWFYLFIYLFILFCIWGYLLEENICSKEVVPLNSLWLGSLLLLVHEEAEKLWQQAGFF